MLLVIYGTILLFYIIVSLTLLKKDYFSPPVIFCGSFLVAVVVSLPNIERWHFELHENTFWVLVLGTTSFLVGFFLIFFKHSHQCDSVFLKKDICISYKAMMVFIAIQLVTIFVHYRFINELSAIYGGDTLAEKVFLYRINVFLTETASSNGVFMPGYCYTLYQFSFCGTFIIIYKAINDIFLKGKTNWIYIFSSILTICITLLTGGRGGTIFLIIYTMGISAVFYMRKNHWTPHFKKKNICKMVVIFSSIIILFFMSMTIIGRDNKEIDSGDMSAIVAEVGEQLSIYWGAQLKLLDLFINEDYQDLDKAAPAFQTLRTQYNWMSYYFDVSEWHNPIFQWFAYVNNVPLGNVYSTFRPFYDDYNYGGVVVFSFIMGIGMGWFYYRVRYQPIYNQKNLDWSVILYGLMFKVAVLSFYDNWFYDLFSVSFIKDIINIVFFNIFFVKIS